MPLKTTTTLAYLTGEKINPAILIVVILKYTVLLILTEWLDWNSNDLIVLV